MLLIVRGCLMSLHDRMTDAMALVQRAGMARTRVRQAKKMLQTNPTSFGWVKQYVISSTALEEAELALLRMRKGQL